jgi:hypothetical protein
MKTRILAVSVLAMFSANIAHADVVFDSLNIAAGSFNARSDGFTEQPLAASFFTSGPPDFSSITLELAATAPADNGSIGVYLVPDDGTGGGLGKAGSPTYTPGGATFTAFTGAQQVGTILDSSLSTSPSAVTVKIAPNIGWDWFTREVRRPNGISAVTAQVLVPRTRLTSIAMVVWVRFRCRLAHTRWWSKLQSLPALLSSVQAWQGSGSSAAGCKRRINLNV